MLNYQRVTHEKRRLLNQAWSCFWDLKPSIEKWNGGSWWLMMMGVDIFENLVEFELHTVAYDFSTVQLFLQPQSPGGASHGGRLAEGSGSAGPTWHLGIWESNGQTAAANNAGAMRSRPIWFDDLQLWCNGGCLMTFLPSWFWIAIAILNVLSVGVI